MFTKHVELAQEYLGFMLLNLFDLILTGLIFSNSGVEANGIPLWVLQNFGKRGFAIFKFLMVIVIVLVCELISYFEVRDNREPVLAKRVILSACGLYVCVVFWEGYLILTHL